MVPPVRTILVVLAGAALLVPAIGVAAAREDPPVTTPVEAIPLPPEPVLPVDPVVVLDPPQPVTIEIEVPTLPDPVLAEPTHKPPKLAQPPAPAPRIAPTAARHVTERETQHRADAAPVATKKPTPIAKPQQRLKQKRLKQERLKQAQRKVLASVSAPQRLIRKHTPAHGVLAAQHSGQDAAFPSTLPATMHRAVLYLPLAAAAVLGILLGLVGAAPVLAGRWPQVFDPIIDASERIVLAGVCLMGVVLTMAITWALTGPGAWSP